MSTYKIGAEQFLRLANVVNFFEVNVTDETKSKINTIRLENKGGNSVAVVTNKKIAAIENLGATEFTDGFCYLKITPEFIEAAKRSSEKGLGITISVIPEFAMATAQTGVGEYINNPCQWFDNSPLDNWRTWIVQAPLISNGIMSWDCFHMETLIRCSPSGKVVFPEFIDADKPVLLRDRYKPDNWIGIFVPGDNLPPDTVHAIKGRYVPTWLGV